jgi:hypothetical protein
VQPLIKFGQHISSSDVDVGDGFRRNDDPFGKRRSRATAWSTCS